MDIFVRDLMGGNFSMLKSFKVIFSNNIFKFDRVNA